MITLKTLPQASAQEVYDQVRDHLLQQNAQSLRDPSHCAYRSPSGQRCAAGCLIADGEYENRMEGFSWRDLWVRGLVPDVHRGLISELQRVHDCVPVTLWAGQLKVIAVRHGLTP